jgi:diguanylate cyclase (GGDEF)-like protein
VEEIIARFVELIQTEFPVSGHVYMNETPAISCRGGHTNRHSLAYTLTMEGHALGELRLFHSRSMAEADVRQLEERISLLFYPLRNAIQYRLAVESAFKDPLTGLRNRFDMAVEIEREINLCHRHEQHMCLLIIDIDHFKRLNDTHGHLNGDRVIICVAHALRETLRETDLIFRYGGEEFTIVLSNTAAADALQIAERIRTTIAGLNCKIEGNVDVSPRVSIGLTQLQPDDGAGSLFQRADTALYNAKSAGRNCCRLG